MPELHGDRAEEGGESSMVTLKDVAREAGVSIATVSYALNQTKPISEETRARVFEAVKKTNYKRIRTTYSRHTLTIGVLSEDVHGFPTPYILDGISETLEASGFHMLLEDLHLGNQLDNNFDHIGLYREKINTKLKVLANCGLDGIIYIGMQDRNLDYMLDPVQLPMVYAYLSMSDSPFITYDNVQAAVEATRALIQQGHRRIGVFSGPPNAYPSMQRMIGYQLAMQQAGLPIRQEWICYGDWSWESGRVCAEQLLSLEERPTAVFAMNDVMASACVRSAGERGLNVPRDLSVIGFNNQELSSYLIPQLSSVQIPMREIGVRCGQQLVRHIKNPREPIGQYTLPCRLVMRESVGPAPRE